MNHSPDRMNLYDGRRLLGSVSTDDFEFLCQRVVLEHPDDEEIYIDRNLIIFLQLEGGSLELLSALEAGYDLHGDEGFELSWVPSTRPAHRGPYR